MGDLYEFLLDSYPPPLSPSAREGESMAEPPRARDGESNAKLSAREGESMAGPSTCGRDLGWGIFKESFAKSTLTISSNLTQNSRAFNDLRIS